jgi:chromosome segregation ATPase
MGRWGLLVAGGALALLIAGCGVPKGEYDKAQKALQDAKEQIASLQSQVQDLQAKVTGLQADRDKEKARADEQTAAVETMKKDLEGQITALKEQVTKADQARAAAAIATDVANEQVVKLKPVAAEAERLAQQVKDLTTKVTNLEADKKALQTALASAKDEINRMWAAVKKLPGGIGEQFEKWLQALKSEGEKGAAPAPAPAPAAPAAPGSRPGTAPAPAPKK